MSVRWYTVVVDCEDVAAQARWWAEVLDWRIVYEAPDEVVVVPPHALTKADIIPVEEQGPNPSRDQQRAMAVRATETCC